MIGFVDGRGVSNAGHTIYINKKKYITHIVPVGIFYNKYSYIGPECYINIEDLKNELEYLKKHNLDTNLVKISGKCYIVTKTHKIEDKNIHYLTSKGDCPMCAR